MTLVRRTSLARKARANNADGIDPKDKEQEDWLCHETMFAAWTSEGIIAIAHYENLLMLILQGYLRDS
jgi:hypothetical protein